MPFYFHFYQLSATHQEGIRRDDAVYLYVDVGGIANGMRLNEVVTGEILAWDKPGLAQGMISFPSPLHKPSNRIISPKHLLFPISNNPKTPIASRKQGLSSQLHVYQILSDIDTLIRKRTFPNSLTSIYLLHWSCVSRCTTHATDV